MLDKVTVACAHIVASGKGNQLHDVLDMAWAKLAGRKGAFDPKGAAERKQQAAEKANALAKRRAAAFDDLAAHHQEVAVAAAAAAAADTSSRPGQVQGQGAALTPHRSIGTRALEAARRKRAALLWFASAAGEARSRTAFRWLVAQANLAGCGVGHLVLNGEAGSARKEAAAALACVASDLKRTARRRTDAVRFLAMQVSHTLGHSATARRCSREGGSVLSVLSTPKILRLRASHSQPTGKGPCLLIIP